MLLAIAALWIFCILAAWSLVFVSRVPDIGKGGGRPMIATALRMPNDMVAVFDELGQQLPAYQGRYLEVREKIMLDAPLSARFETIIQGVGAVAVHRTTW